MEVNTGEGKYEVSVILTLYNSRKFYRKALDSVLEQSFKNIEIIIVDDGSTDGIENEILHIINDHRNIIYIKQSNCGHALSLNRGIANSGGRYITVIDSDDEYEPDHIELRVKYFESNPDVDLIHSPAKLVGEEEDFFVPDALDTSVLIHLNECIIGGTLFGRREVFTSLNGFKNIYSHDSDFFRRAGEKFRTEKLDLPTYIYYRNNPDSVISKLKTEKHGRE